MHLVELVFAKAISSKLIQCNCCVCIILFFITIQFLNFSASEKSITLATVSDLFLRVALVGKNILRDRT